MLMVSTFDSFFWTFILSLYIIIQQLVVIMNNKRLRRTNNIRLNNKLPKHLKCHNRIKQRPVIQTENDISH